MHNYISVIRALGDENRLRILMALRLRPLCVCEITTLLGLAASTTSNQARLNMPPARGAGRCCCWPATA